MRYVVDIDGTICYPGPDDEKRYTHATLDGIVSR